MFLIGYPMGDSKGQGGYPPQTGYAPQSGYPPQTGYPPQGGGYAPQPGGYPPPSEAYGAGYNQPSNYGEYVVGPNDYR